MAPQGVVIPPAGQWGLSPVADLAYRTLLLLGPAGDPGLARELGLDPGRIAVAMDELEGVGAVRRSGRGRERRWVARDVAEVASIMRGRRRPVNVADQHRRHFAAVAGVHLERIPPDLVRRLSDRESTRHRIAELVRAERREHLAINIEDVITADAAAVAGPLDQALLDRGVRLRTLGLKAQDGSRTFVLDGCEYREADTLPLKLMIFDRRSALFPADPADFEAGAVEVTDPDAVARLTTLFYSIWRTAGDPSREEVPPIVLTAREQTILGLLAAGASEEAAAAELGLSRRTVVYTMRALMDRLGVENRFQLALLLGASRAVPLPRAARPAEPATSATTTDVPQEEIEK
jgi:DNA-binding CsgD family transcriptional regulator